ncbi:V-type ATP synthase subunit E [Candidatus Gracilibacteria bacterium]|nr:V-type ATP synthase subunit E [Candidatus Gracilibacteria bacterium]
MALQDILKKIIDEAGVEIKKIEADLEEKKAKLVANSANIEKAELESLDTKTKNALESVETKTRSMARQENSKELLRTKQVLINDALDSFLVMLEGLDDKMYGQLLEKLFESSRATSGKVFAPPKRLEITSRIAPPGFDVVAKNDITGGFVLVTGASEIDNSFRNLVFSEFREALTSYFAEQLKLV